MTGKLWTIGHSTVDADEFNSILHDADIEVLVDVRSLPGSRKFPHFNQEAMPTRLKVKYTHIPNLGGLRRTARSGLNEGWRNASFRSYADYMLTEKFEQGIAELLQLARRQRVAYMCAEAVPWRCHRSLISDTLASRGVEVTHLIGTNALPHVLGKWGPEVTQKDGHLYYG
jgi:uncharacterized protein (DUF488 family)